MPRPKPSQQGLPGNWVQKLARSSIVLRTILSHSNMLQIVEDHQYLWLTATQPAERKLIVRRLCKQLALATVNFAGLETAIHGTVIAVLGDPLHGGVLIVCGALVMKLIAGKGGG